MSKRVPPPPLAPVQIYWQYGRSHAIPAQQLVCELDAASVEPQGSKGDEVKTPPQDDGHAWGHGFDDVGTFNLTGGFKRDKLCLTKQYVLGTGVRWGRSTNQPPPPPSTRARPSDDCWVPDRRTHTRIWVTRSSCD